MTADTDPWPTATTVETTGSIEESLSAALAVLRGSEAPDAP
jgi:hypothetical protein